MKWNLETMREQTTFKGRAENSTPIQRKIKKNSKALLLQIVEFIEFKWRKKVLKTLNYFNQTSITVQAVQRKIKKISKRTIDQGDSAK